MGASVPPAALAFDAIAETFDERFGGWLSVAAQRRAVRNHLISIFPEGAKVLEIGGGTGEDAAWLASQCRQVVVTEPSPRMVEVARRKLAGMPGAQVLQTPAEDLADFATGFSEGTFDGAFSNFAGLNCVTDLTPVARGLARLVRPGASVALVLFGPFPPGELVVETLRGRWRAGFRRLARRDVPARLSGQEFFVRYHRAKDVEAVMQPWFKSTGRLGVGVFVPPSAAEPWISRQPRLLGVLESLDRALARPLALLGDHVLYSFVRTDAPSPGANS